jgi:hypothetical protein
VIATILVGLSPLSISIQPPPRFAGVPGSSNCHGTSVSALATKFGNLDAAAAPLRFPTVQGLQDAISAFCGDSSSRLSARGTGTGHLGHYDHRPRATALSGNREGNVSCVSDCTWRPQGCC